MGATWSGGSLSVKVSDVGNKALHKTVWEINNLANMILSKGAKEMQYIISTTPSSIVPGKSNRIYTGAMKDNVSYENMKRAGNGRYDYEGSAGWSFFVADYFLVQEYGGVSSGLRLGDRVITPMHALSKIYYSMLGDLQNGIRHLSA